MADAKTTALTAATSWASGDLLYLVRDPAGTPVSRKITVDNIIANIPVNGAASTPPLKLSGTWFTGGSSTTTKPQMLIEPAGTTSTSWSTSGTGLGVNAPSGFGGDLLHLQLNGATYLRINSSANMSVAGYIYSPTLNGSTLRLGGEGVSDCLLVRDAANTLALRNGANAQALNVYNTYTSGSVYERGFMRWVSNALEIGTEHVGASARALAFKTGANTRLSISGSGTVISSDTSTSIHFGPDNRTNISGNTVVAMTYQSLQVNNASYIGFSNDAFAAATIDAAFRRVSANIIGVNNGSTGGGALAFVEMTSPAAPAANSVYIFAEDNGAGKTRLMARFATGATQQISIEP